MLSDFKQISTKFLCCWILLLYILAKYFAKQYRSCNIWSTQRKIIYVIFLLFRDQRTKFLSCWMLFIAFEIFHIFIKIYVRYISYLKIRIKIINKCIKIIQNINQYIYQYELNNKYQTIYKKHYINYKY